MARQGTLFFGTRALVLSALSTHEGSNLIAGIIYGPAESSLERGSRKPINQHH